MAIIFKAKPKLPWFSLFWGYLFILLLGQSSFAKAQQRLDLGIYLGPDQSSSIIRQSQLDSLNIAYELSSSPLPTIAKLKHYFYPKLKADLAAEQDLEQLFKEGVFKATQSVGTLSFHPQQLAYADRDLQQSNAAFYTERAFSFFSEYPKMDTTKPIWLLISPRDLNRGLEKLDAFSTGSIEALIWVGSLNDYHLKEMEKLAAFCDSLKVQKVFFRADVLSQAMDRDQNLGLFLRALERGERLSIPLSNEKAKSPLQQFAFIIILINIGLFTIHFALSGRYERSIKRFYTNTRFFIQELQSWRNPLGVSGSLLVLQFALLHTTLLVLLLQKLLSEHGMQYLIEMIFGYSFEQGIYLQASVLILFLELVLVLAIIIWSNFWNAGFRHLGQTITTLGFSSHSLLLLFVPAIIFVDRYTESYWLIGILTLVTALLYVFLHFRGQLLAVKCTTNQGLQSIVGGFASFWVLIGVILSILLSQTQWYEWAYIASRFP